MNEQSSIQTIASTIKSPKSEGKVHEITDQEPSTKKIILFSSSIQTTTIRTHFDQNEMDTHQKLERNDNTKSEDKKSRSVVDHKKSELENHIILLSIMVQRYLLGYAVATLLIFGFGFVLLKKQNQEQSPIQSNTKVVAIRPPDNLTLLKVEKN